VVAKTTPARIGPTRINESAWVNDPLIKEDSFVAWVGGPGAAPMQVTFHRPIGSTDLDGKKDWVATPTSELALLATRRSSEETARWERAAAAAIRQQVLNAREGRKKEGAQDSEKEFWAFEGSPECGPTIKTAMANAKAAGKAESAWTDFVSNEIKVAEATFKSACKATDRWSAYEAGNPKPDFETRGGPLNDRPQRAVPYLFGLSLAAARDRVTAVLYGDFLIKEVVTEVFVERVAEED
jgi:hypothetical protein